MRVFNWVQAVDKLTGVFEKPEIIHSVNTNRCEGGGGQDRTIRNPDEKSHASWHAPFFFFALLSYACSGQ